MERQSTHRRPCTGSALIRFGAMHARTIRGGGDPQASMARMPWERMGPPPRSLAADAHGCIMVGGSRQARPSIEYKVVARMAPRHGRLASDRLAWRHPSTARRRQVGVSGTGPPPAAPTRKPKQVERKGGADGKLCA